MAKKVLPKGVLIKASTTKVAPVKKPLEKIKPTGYDKMVVSYKVGGTRKYKNIK